MGFLDQYNVPLSDCFPERILPLSRFSCRMGSRDLASHLSGTGAVRELEVRLKRLYEMRHCLCVSSATIGLVGVALALDLRGADFITTPYTWGGTLAGWLLLGNRPVFADIEPRTLGLDAESMRHRI